MNGLVGCLEKISSEFDSLDPKNIGQGIKQGLRYNDKIIEAEAMKEMQEKKKEAEEPINVAELTQEIREDMEK